MKLFPTSPLLPIHHYQPDPFIFENEGTYYVYATHLHGVQVYRSRDFKSWEFLGILFKREGFSHYWAPCMMKKDGTFYLYFSAKPDAETDDHMQRLQVASAPTPEGPFTFEREIAEPFSIDPHAIDTPEGMYMIYSINDWEAERAGTYVVMDKMTDPTHLEGAPRAAVRPTMDEEIHAYDRFRKGQNWHTIEGGCYYRRGDTHYLLYSGAGYTGNRYFVGYAVAHNHPSDLRDLEWKKCPDDHTFRPLLFENEFVEGTGHNSLIEKDGELYIVYHARDKGVCHLLGRDDREMRADKVIVNGDELTVTIEK